MGNCWDISWCCIFFKPWTGFVSQGNEFSYYMLICSSFILNQYDNILNISYTPAIHCSYFIMTIFLFLPAPKRLMNGLYILGYTVTAILFQTMINFGLFHFQIFIPQGTYYPCVSYQRSYCTFAVWRTSYFPYKNMTFGCWNICI